MEYFGLIFETLSILLLWAYLRDEKNSFHKKPNLENKDNFQKTSKLYFLCF